MSVLLWLVALEALGLAALPLGQRLFSALPDRGFATSKMLGLLLVSYVAWVTGMLGLTAFTGPTMVVLTLLLAAAAWWRWGDGVRADWSRMRALVLGAELTFLVTFLLAVAVRAFNSAIAGQEKQMDMTFLHSLILTSTLPAEDLWLAGYGMPYYYLGYLTQAVIAKATAIEPAIAYNLAVASVLALAAVGAFGLAAGLVRLAGASTRIAMAVGIFGAFVLTIMGNLEAFFEVVAAQGIGDRAFWANIGIKNLEANAGPFPPSDGGWWFRAARVIPNIQPDGITEFPYFSLILGDLHPHYMAIPLAILIATLAAQAITRRTPFFRNDPAYPPETDEQAGAASRPHRETRGTDWIRFGLTAVVLGAVIPFNTWDLPVLWGLFGLSVLLPSLIGRAADAVDPGRPPLEGRPARTAPDGRWGPIRDRAAELGLLAVLAVALFAPYLFIGYTSQPLGLGLTRERTLFGSLFVLFGPLLLLPLFAGVSAALADMRGSAARNSPTTVIQALGVLAGLTLVVAREPTLGFLVASLGLWLPLVWIRVREEVSPQAVSTALLTCIGLGSILVPELVYLSDSFQSRMNTVFKFYYDAWILLALAAPLLAWELWRRVLAPAAPWDRGLAGSALALAAILTLAGAIYPVAATHTKSGGFARTPTLDGLSYLREARPDDVAAIAWLKRNHPGAVVVEAVGNDYTDAARISTFAGTPTLIGWVGHQLQWRGPTPELDRRQQLTRRIYTDPASVDWVDTIERFGVQFVVVGSMERELYGQDVGSRVERTLTPVHQSGTTVIYSPRPRPSGAGAL